MKNSTWTSTRRPTWPSRSTTRHDSSKASRRSMPGSACPRSGGTRSEDRNPLVRPARRGRGTTRSTGVPGPAQVDPGRWSLHALESGWADGGDRRGSRGSATGRRMGCRNLPRRAEFGYDDPGSSPKLDRGHFPMLRITAGKPTALRRPEPAGCAAGGRGGDARALGLPALLRARVGPGPKAKSLILFVLEGGPAAPGPLGHEARRPRESSGASSGRSRRPYRASMFCEHLPMLAKQAHHLTLVRSVHHTIGDHNAGAYYAMTGPRPLDRRSADHRPGRRTISRRSGRSWRSSGRRAGRCRISSTCRTG